MSDPPVVEVYAGNEVVADFDPALTFECVEDCTWCCHHGVLLYEPDLLALADCANLGEVTTQFQGRDFVRQETKDRDDHVDEDGAACYFLRDDGLCSLHADHDCEAAQDHCDGLHVSERRVVDNLDAFLPAVLWELDDPTTLVAL